MFLAARLTGNPLEMMYPEGLPPDQEERLLAEYGLDKPIPVQFLRYVRELSQGNFGVSLREKRPVAEMYAEDIGATLKLAGLAFLVSVAFGIPIGMVGALKRRTGTGRFVMSVAFLGYAVPHFIIALSLILVFGFYLHWLPSTGNATVWHYVLPTVTLAAHRFASIARHTRSSLLDVLSQDFMRTARAKGLEERVVIFKHALRNSLIPVITILGLQVAGLDQRVDHRRDGVRLARDRAAVRGRGPQARFPGPAVRRPVLRRHRRSGEFSGGHFLRRHRPAHSNGRMRTIVPSPEPPAEATCTPEIEEVALGPSNLPPGAAVRGGRFFDRVKSAPPSIHLCLALMLLMAIAAVAAPWVAPFDPNQSNVLQRNAPPSWMGGKSGHLLGTDQLGRDVLSRCIYALRVSVGIACSGSPSGA